MAMALRQLLTGGKGFVPMVGPLAQQARFYGTKPTGGAPTLEKTEDTATPTKVEGAPDVKVELKAQRATVLGTELPVLASTREDFATATKLVEEHLELLKAAQQPDYKPPEVQAFGKDDWSREDFPQEFTRQITFKGPGLVVLKGFYDPRLIEACREDLDILFATQGEQVTHFQGDEGQRQTQARNWNTPFHAPRGEYNFMRVLANPTMLNFWRDLLGTEYTLGSLAANCIYPGNKGQDWHQDFPRWRGMDPERYVTHNLVSHLATLQLGIPVHEFTEMNGGTEFVAGTHILSSHPPAGFTAEQARKMPGFFKLVADVGDVVAFNGATWHRAAANMSDGPRSSLLAQVLPGQIKGMEDYRKLEQQVRDIIPQVTEDPQLRVEMQDMFLGTKFVYPEDLSQSTASSTEGTSKKK